MADTPQDDAPISYPPETVLEIEHVARWLRIGVRQVERKNVPCFYVGTRTRRYLAASVIEWMRKQES